MNEMPSKEQSDRRSGFSLVEIAIVVAVIGLLAAIAIPAFQKARISGMASRIANDYRIFANAFQTCALEGGSWPADEPGNAIPALAQAYIKDSTWNEGVVKGSWWGWEGPGRHGFGASISFVDEGENLETGVMERVDEMLDDGDLTSGVLREVAGNGYIYILQM